MSHTKHMFVVIHFLWKSSKWTNRLFIRHQRIHKVGSRSVKSDLSLSKSPSQETEMRVTTWQQTKKHLRPDLPATATPLAPPAVPPETKLDVSSAELPVLILWRLDGVCDVTSSSTSSPSSPSSGSDIRTTLPPPPPAPLGLEPRPTLFLLKVEAFKDTVGT